MFVFFSNCICKCYDYFINVRVIIIECFMWNINFGFSLGFGQGLYFYIEMFVNVFLYKLDLSRDIQDIEIFFLRF